MSAGSQGTRTAGLRDPARPSMTEEEAVAALQGFCSGEDNPRFRPDPYHLRDLADHVRRFSAPHLEQRLAARLRAAIVAGMQKLDALPRSDTFWAGTNRRPTLGKLPDFAGQMLGRSSQEEWACWVLAACSLSWCSN